jgi:thiol-disulfide isomerase/thioredoxin
MEKKIFFIVLIVVAGCTAQTSTTSDSTGASSGETSIAAPWMDAEFMDVATGEAFKISDFRGKPVLVESFAVWCTTCLKQQQEIKKLAESEGDAIVHVSLDTDPNEDEERVKAHILTHGFDWYYAISPVATTQQLIDDFGVNIVNAPLAPVILVCEDGSSRLLDSGVKSSDQLLVEIEKGC